MKYSQILLILPILVSFSLKPTEPKYFYISEYEAIIRMFNCSEVIKKDITNGRRIVVVPRTKCREFYLKCYRKSDNELLEEGLYKCNGNVQEVEVESRNDNSSTYSKNKEYQVKRTGKWTFYNNGNKKIVFY